VGDPLITLKQAQEATRTIPKEELEEGLRPFLIRQRFCPFTMDELSRWAILNTLWAFGGNRTWTAKHLGLSIRTVRNQLSRYRVLGYYVPTGDRHPSISRGQMSQVQR
jgi:DNA-binding NtrC family response regulator